MTTTPSPTFSVVVPSYRRAAPLRACLAALAALDHPRDRYEVLVVDDGSPEPMAAVADPFRARMRLTVHRQENAGPAAARNSGARLARGDHLAFTDDDCRPEPGWLTAMAAALSSRPGTMVGGHVVNVLDNQFAAASQALIDYLYGYFGDSGRDAFFASNNIALPTEAFLDLGGFDTGYPRPGAEDRDLCDRWARAGRPMVFAPDAVVSHAHHMDLRGFWRQHANYGRGAYHFHRLRAARSGHRRRLEPLDFYAGLLAHPFDRVPVRRAVPTALLLGLSQVANAVGYVAEHRSRADHPRRAERPPSSGPSGPSIGRRGGDEGLPSASER